MNGRAKVNVPFGGSLTAVATLPEGSSRTLGDPFAEKPKPVWLYVTLGVVALLLVLWIGGTVNEYIPLRWQFKHLVG